MKKFGHKLCWTPIFSFVLITFYTQPIKYVFPLSTTRVTGVVDYDSGSSRSVPSIPTIYTTAILFLFLERFRENRKSQNNKALEPAFLFKNRYISV